MKKAIILLAVCASLVCSCKKTVPLSEYPFEVSYKGLLYDSCFLDIMPETNDFLYGVYVISRAEFTMFGTEQALVNELDKRLRAEYDTYYKEYIEFREYLYQGSYDYLSGELIPETDYVGVVFKYNDDLTPDPHPVTVNFKTPARTVSDLKFEVYGTGSELTVRPSNDKDSYLTCHYDKPYIDEEYEKSILVFTALMELTYRTYGMLPGSMEKTGTFTEELMESYALTEGDQILMTVFGYRNGRTTGYSTYCYTYNGAGKPATIEAYEDPYKEFFDVETKSGCFKSEFLRKYLPENVKVLGTK